MPGEGSLQPTRRQLTVESVAVGVFGLTAAAVVFQLWRQPFGVPFNYEGDGAYYLMFAQGLKRHGSFLVNPDLGLPGRQVLYDVPEGLDLLNIAVLRILTLAASAVVAVNAFVLITFATVGAAAHAVLRRLGLPRLIAATAAVLYDFLPYHLMRRGAHLFLISYAFVPVVVWYAVALLGDRTPDLDVRRAAGRWTALACVGVALTGPYYAAFGALLWPVSGALGGLRRRSWGPFVRSLQMAALVGLSALAALIPNLAYWAHHGRNPAVIQRAPVQTEIYGLRIQQLLMPRWDHRNPFLARVGLDALRGPVQGEGTSYLGVIGAVGFLVLVVVACARVAGRSPADSERGRLLDRLAVITLVAVLLATVGGFGYFVNRAGLREIRAYNRMSILIGFTALAAVGVLAASGTDRLAARRPVLSRRILAAGVAGALIVGWYDQTAPRDSVYVSGGHSAWKADAAFYGAMAAALPPGAAILQVPEVGFPESTGVGDIGSYDEGRGYIHSPSLRWSFGGVTGRSNALPSGLVEGSAADLVAWSRANGFRAILVDRFGFTDQGAALTARLSGAGLPVGGRSADANERLVWYDLGGG